MDDVMSTVPLASPAAQVALHNSDTERRGRQQRQARWAQRPC